MPAAPFHHPSHVLGALSTTHRRVGIVPGSDSTLRYVLPVPRGWGRVSGLAACPRAHEPEPLGLFSPQPDLAGPRIIVSVTRLRWEVDPLGWVRHGFERAGWTVAVARPLQARWHPRFEVGALRRIDGRVEVRRSTGLVDNGRLLRVDVAAPSSQWSSLHDLLWPSGVCMSLVQPTFCRKIEATQRHGGPRVAFELPQSWSARPVAPPRPDGTRWVASPDEGLGRAVALRIDAVPWQRGAAEPIAIRQGRVRNELRSQGLAVARRGWAVEPGGAAEAPGFAGMFRTEARDDDDTFELRFAHCDIDGLSLDLTTVVASPQRFPLDRMRAERALEIVLATVQTRPRKEIHAA